MRAVFILSVYMTNMVKFQQCIKSAPKKGIKHDAFLCFSTDVAH